MVPRKIRQAVFAVMAAFALVACSADQDLQSAQSVVPQIHRQIADGNYEQIYAQSGEGFRETISVEDARDLFRAIHDKLGPVKSTTLDAWNIRYTGQLKTVRLEYDTEFERGRGKERFAFLVNGEKVNLVGYNIDAPALGGSPKKEPPAAH